MCAKCRFFSTVVRIQSERGYVVVYDGPYWLMRHPGYLGGILMALSAPVVLGSYWGLAPGVTVVALVVVRTRLEDRFLPRGAARLPGLCGEGTLPPRAGDLVNLRDWALRRPGVVCGPVHVPAAKGQGWPRSRAVAGWPFRMQEPTDRRTVSLLVRILRRFCPLGGE